MQMREAEEGGDIYVDRISTSSRQEESGAKEEKNSNQDDKYTCLNLLCGQFGHVAKFKAIT
jgi:hypothetical protein